MKVYVGENVDNRANENTVRAFARWPMKSMLNEEQQQRRRKNREAAAPVAAAAQ